MDDPNLERCRGFRCSCHAGLVCYAALIIFVSVLTLRYAQTQTMPSSGTSLRENAFDSYDDGPRYCILSFFRISLFWLTVGRLPHGFNLTATCARVSWRARDTLPLQFWPLFLDPRSPRVSAIRGPRPPPCDTEH